MNSSTSVDQDYANITEGNPEYYWLCRNISNPEFDTNLSAIPFVTVPEVVTGYMEVQCNPIENTLRVISSEVLLQKQRDVFLSSACFSLGCVCEWSTGLPSRTSGDS